MSRLMSAARSVSKRMRAKRFERFRELLSRLPRPVKILDIGGTNFFWQSTGLAGDADYQVTLLNLEAEEQVHANIASLAGDATDLSGFADGAFDVISSNSVIEHLYTFERQQQMAEEVRLAAPNYWVQTPNFWFPIEPHFHFVGWQWLPESVRVGILRRKRCGWRGKTPDPEAARDIVSEVRLMTRAEIARAFPDAAIQAQRMLGLVKSWIAVGGFAKG